MGCGLPPTSTGKPWPRRQAGFCLRRVVFPLSWSARHTTSVGCPEIDRMLLFRDWLRSHDADRDLYEFCSKRDLARRTWKYVQNYADAKTSIVEEIIARASASKE